MEFTLEDVLSKRICDPVDGWRERRSEEVITLTDAQKASFVQELGYRAHRPTKIALTRYINAPYYPHESWFLKRVTWHGDRCIYNGGQDCIAEIAEIRKIIC